MKPVSIFAVPSDLPHDERMKRRQLLARLGFAWLIMMQVMMFAFPGYMRRDFLHSESLATLDVAIVVMNWISLALSVPLILYCAKPVWAGLFQKSADSSWINMNTPVALGIIVSFVPSVIVTWTHHGEVYYESIAMFIAFLLTARYLEYAAVQSAKFSPSKVEPLLEQTRQVLSKKADRVAFVFIVAQIVLAIVTSLVWYFFIDESQAIAVLVALFVMSCPCAMAMAVPTASSAAQAVFLNNSYGNEQKEKIIQETVHCANQNLYGSLVWHLLMTPLAMMGIVAPWLAAITMLISSLAVAWNAYHHYKKLIKGTESGMVLEAVS